LIEKLVEAQRKRVKWWRRLLESETPAPSSTKISGTYEFDEENLLDLTCPKCGNVNDVSKVPENVVIECVKCHCKFEYELYESKGEKRIKVRMR